MKPSTPVCVSEAKADLPQLSVAPFTAPLTRPHQVPRGCLHADFGEAVVLRKLVKIPLAAGPRVVPVETGALQPLERVKQDHRGLPTCSRYHKKEDGIAGPHSAALHALARHPTSGS